MRYVITGQEGLIGKEFKKRLKAAGHECVLEVDLRKDNKNINYMPSMKVEKVDMVFHLAAFCKINQSIEDPTLVFENNVKGTFNVMEFCRKYRIPKIVFFSSTRILSKEQNPYTVSKIYGESLVKAYCECYDMEYLIIRPSTVYGGKDSTHRLIDIWINNAKKDLPLTIYGDREKTLDFTYVDDFLDAFEIALRSGWNQEHNISGKCEELLLDVAKEIISQLNSKSEIAFEDAEKAQPQKVHIKNTIRYNPKVNISEGIKRCIK